MTSDFSSARAAIAAHYVKTESKRHAAETRWVAALPDFSAMLAYFAGVEEKRGVECALKLREDVRNELRRKRRST